MRENEQSLQTLAPNLCITSPEIDPECMYIEVNNTASHHILCLFMSFFTQCGNWLTMFKPFLPIGSRSRVRLSATIISALEWNLFDADFECIGLFRRPDELICAPMTLQCEDGDHPFADAIALAESVRATVDRTLRLSEIPSIRDFLASGRLIYFKATWTTDAHSQLDLNLGAEVTGQLGWAKPPHSTTPIYLGSHGRMLLAVSERRLNAAREEVLFGPGKEH